MSENKFNIRVYGILANSRNQILVSDERRDNFFFTKFPGGGLEWGEGLKDCLMREFKEELDIEIEVDDLFYCTDFFVESAWRKTDQLISIYYKVHCDCIEKLDFETYSIPFSEQQEKFRWLSFNELSEENFTFPIDKLVAQRLREFQYIRT